jgi:CheY-like chemotaxis protein
MGGSVGVSSAPGQGATFWLTLSLPLTNAPPQVQTNELPRVASKLDVLVVDDNAVNRMVATRLLEALDCQATTVSSGREALDSLTTRTFDCILMDCQMPDMDGFETTRLIRAMPDRSHIPIIAVTAGVLEEDRNRCEQAGMDGFLPKPMSKAALASALSKITTHHPSRISPV